MRRVLEDMRRYAAEAAAPPNDNLDLCADINTFAAYHEKAKATK